MIFFLCFFENVKAANVFAEFGHEVWDGDDEFNAKINVTNREEFKRLLNHLNEIKREDILEILEAHCHSFESDGEIIPEELEDEIYTEIKALLS